MRAWPWLFVYILIEVSPLSPVPKITRFNSASGCYIASHLANSEPGVTAQCEYSRYISSIDSRFKADQ
jgi:hypothetical protein